MVDCWNVEDAVADMDQGSLKTGVVELVAFAYQLADAGDVEVDELIDEGIEIGRGNRVDVLVNRLQTDPGSVTIEDLVLLATDGAFDEDRIVDFAGDAIAETGAYGVGSFSNAERAAEMVGRYLLEEHRREEAPQDEYRDG